jgi:hypothetical protein
MGSFENRGKTFNFGEGSKSNKSERDFNDPPKGVMVVHYCPERKGEKILMHLDDLDPKWEIKNGTWCADVACPDCKKTESFSESRDIEAESGIKKAA